MEKLEQEELDQLRSTHAQVRELRNALADVEITAYNAKIEKESILKQLEQSSLGLRTMQEELHAKYGDVTVDFATGEVKKKW